MKNLKNLNKTIKYISGDLYDDVDENQSKNLGGHISISESSFNNKEFFRKWVIRYELWCFYWKCTLNYENSTSKQYTYYYLK